MPAVHLRKVRSFVRRAGRVTTAQRRALDELSGRYGVGDREGRLDLAALFGREAPRVLDIGFGDGEALATSAANYPSLDYLGVEVHEPGIGHLLLLLEKAALTNVRVMVGDATEIVPASLPDASFAAVNLFFPDPWPKKRHHKRRIVQPAFVAEIARVLEPGGLLHVATDWADYVEHTGAVVAENREFVPIAWDDLCHNPVAFRPPTKFERRGRRLGHDVVDLFFVKGKPAVPVESAR
jgi:tRNA (guanine-N7-)-methyltransferase